MRNVLRVMVIAAAWAGGCAVDEGSTGSIEEPLQQGLPAIVSTTINAPIVSGRYQLITGKAYTVTVTVDAGTITYLTRLEPNAMSSTIALAPAYRDDTVIAYRGHTVYAYTITPSAAGNYQVAFELRDRGSWNVFDRDAGVGVTVSSTWVPPRIASTTINAPILNGRYQLYVGVQYGVQITVASSNVTYNVRMEPNGISSTMHLWPPNESSQIAQFSANQVFNFTITPDTVGWYPVAFQLRDPNTGNIFNVDGGVPATVLPSDKPRITSTTITGVTPNSAGEYVLSVGQRYDVVVHVLAGTVARCATVEVADPTAQPASANIHNKRATGYPKIDATDPYTRAMDFHFGLTPTDWGSYQLGFQMRGGDGVCTGAGTAYNTDPGVAIVAGTSLSAPGTGGIFGTIRTPQGAAVGSATVWLDGGTPTSTAANGTYWFANVPSGVHKITVSKTNYSPTIAVNVPASSSSIQVDLELEELFPALLNASMYYTRYYDYSRGRTLFHVVQLTKLHDHVELMESHNPGGYETAYGIATRVGALVATNGGFFDTPKYDEGHYAPWGYLYIRQPVALAFEIDSTGAYPTFGIVGNSSNQGFFFEDKPAAFLSGGDNPPVGWGWTLINQFAIWDDNRDHISDVDYALQMSPTLVNGTSVYGETAGSMEDTLPLAFWARTAIGTTAYGELLMVVADGQGFGGCQGADLAELASMMKTLGADHALNLDGGGSTQMAVYSSSLGAPKLMTTPTAEYAPFQGTDQHPVENFVMAWRAN